MLGNFKRFYKSVRAKRTYQENINAEKEGAEKPIPGDIDTVKRQLTELIGSCNDFNIKRIPMGKNPVVLVVGMEGLVDKELLDRDVVGSITAYNSRPQNRQKQFIDYLKDQLLNTCSVKEISDLDKAVIPILSGEAVVFTEGSRTALSAGIQKWEKRSPNEPKTGTVLRGPAGRLCGKHCDQPVHGFCRIYRHFGAGVPLKRAAGLQTPSSLMNPVMCRKTMNRGITCIRKKFHPISSA